jgi:GDP-4-dehydro-6-deoxy-D-mannose reductase
MKILVTGADGFAGSHLISILLKHGHQVTGTRLEPRAKSPVLSQAEHDQVQWVTMDLHRSDSVRDAMREAYEAVVHLAAVSGSRDAGADSGYAWAVNAGGTARLLDALVRRDSQARILVVSSSMVYGEGGGQPNRESDPLEPLSAYGATKLGTEICARQFARQFNLDIRIARPWPHTGPHQQTGRQFPDWLVRLRKGEPRVEFGDPDAVRDYLDVRDVVQAYLAILERGTPGTIYNVASGTGLTFRELFGKLCAAAGAVTELVPAPHRRRGWDEQYSVGDASRLMTDTGWSITYDLDQTLRDMVHAQTH